VVLTDIETHIVMDEDLQWRLKLRNDPPPARAQMKCSVCGDSARYQGGVRATDQTGFETDTYLSVFFCPDHASRSDIVKTIREVTGSETLKRLGTFRIIWRPIKIRC